tara:strand:+ start:224 stop:2098 length:1875 start_codon:yes stop_codon:yes gene_type:complete
MPQTAYVGKKHGLVFPVMCSGYIKIPYDTQTRGFWEHNDSFTIESVITPYDVNGYGIERDKSGLTTSYASGVSTKKIMPSLDKVTKDDASEKNKFQDFHYITYAERFNHKMYLFYNPKVELYLENTTTTNENQPAEYKINFKVVTSGSTKTITSDAVILSRTEAYNVLQESDGTLIQTVYNKDVDAPLYVRASNTASDTDNYMTCNGVSGSELTVSITGGSKAEEFVAPNQKIYTSDGTLIGTVKEDNSPSSIPFPSNLVIDCTSNISPTPSGQIYIEAPKQAIYTESTYHIAATFEASTGDMNIYVNGFNVKSDTHANPNPFYWGTEDSYIGQNASLSETIDKTTAVVWVDTDSLTSTIQGQAITSVTNQGSGGDFSESAADAPFLLHDESINNYPILSFGSAGLFRGSYATLSTNWDMIVALKNSEASTTTLVAGNASGDHIQIKKTGDVYYLEIEDNTTAVTSSTTSSILHGASYGAQVLRFKKTGDVLYIYNNGKYLQTVDVSAIGTLSLDFIGTVSTGPSTDATANAKILSLIIENDNFSDEYANKVQGLLCDKYITPSTHNPFENTYRKAARNTQFMGQLHDFAITKTARKFFDSLYTLVPQQKNTLLYYRFEEVKDD